MPAASRTSCVEVGPPSCSNRSFPPTDQLRALRPQDSASAQIFENRILLPAIEEDPRDRDIKSILFDSTCPGCCCGLQEVTFGIFDVIPIERDLRQDKISRVDRISRSRVFAQEFLCVG